MYFTELRKLQESLKALAEICEKARKFLIENEKIHWAHVGNLKRVNMALEEALQQSLVPQNQNKMYTPGNYKGRSTKS